MPQIAYRVIRSDRKTVSLQILPDGQVVVRCPRAYPTAGIEAFVNSKQAWIEKHLKKKSAGLPGFTDQQIRELADKASRYIPQRVQHFAPLVGVRYGNITIRNQKTRWGSCSGKGNLNFNCLLMLAPAEVIDYVVIHELCHRKEMNHSDQFWALVERHCPDYKRLRKWLKDNGPALIARMVR